jgi:hypothetical protein
MTIGLLFLLAILGAIGLVIVKGSQAVRSIVGYVILYCIVRILDDRLLKGGVSEFVRSAIQAIINAFQTVFNPNDFGALALSVVVIGLLILLLFKASSTVKSVVTFTLIYVILRFLEVALFGTGFGLFMHDVFTNISAAFASGAAGL